GPAAELLTIEPGYEIAVAAALGAAADAVAVTDPATAADAIRLLRERDAGRAAMLLGAELADGAAAAPRHVPEQTFARETAESPAPAVLPAQGGAGAGSGARSGPDAEAHPADRAGTTTALAAPSVADLVRGPAALLGAVRGLVPDTVVVGTLEEAEELVAAHPGITAVTAEGDVLSAHFAHGGSAGAPSLLEVQASVDEAAAELAELAVRCEELAE
ncbi:chromosome segregation protein SMC, partial [Streptomyces sp. SID724]|nr:chromosome segregation protein SMC [Streptomyces sp. SID724]